MDRMNLREAAERTTRSITTLRRYIRDGRLRAEKLHGRYGPEYFVSGDDLSHAGLHASPDEHPVPQGPSALPAAPGALERIFRESVPMSLYQELRMKHEQLLVQYGMVRAGGLRILELQPELDAKRRQVDACQAEIARLKERLSRETSLLRKKLREAELELEGRHLENASLREKTRALEMLTRNAVTSETIERKFSEVLEQSRIVDMLTTRQDSDGVASPSWPAPERSAEPEH